jgi:tRNA dimethylallyltransferase
LEKIPIILGPTAVGKTAVSLLLAERIGGEIISADAFQVYRGLDIATAKPGSAELSRVSHHLISILELNEQYSAARFRELTIPLIGQIRARGAVPLIVGGSGLYIKALVDGLFESPPADQAYRDLLRREEEKKGRGYLHRLLMERDPVSAGRIHPHNLKRVIRALEVLELTGVPISQWQIQWGEKDEHRTSNDLAQSAEYIAQSVRLAKGEATTAYCQLPTAYLMIGLRRDRDALYHRINRRVEEMFDCGLVGETERLLEKGIRDNRVAWQALGYKEVAGYLNGEYSREDTMIRLAVNTRHFAKRQLTWWRKDERIHWIDLGVNDLVQDAVNKIMQLIRTIQA